MDEVLRYDFVLPYIKEYGRGFIKHIIEDYFNRLREAILKKEIKELSFDVIKDGIIDVLTEVSFKRMRPVINATGVIVHTNLGRAPLGIDVLDKITQVSKGYCNLEYDLIKGKRGHRNDHIEDLICYLTGGESAMVVNNNASAVLLVLSAFAKDKEVIVSRGELVEIGGSFRIPDVMRFSGAKLVEVGTTNKTHLYDYENAITENTAMLMKVHRSNFKIVGFTEEVKRKPLMELAHKNNLIFVEDLGSGILIDLKEFGFYGEDTVADCIKDGVDIVTFSGDKMLGGPQLGYIVGKRYLVDKLKKHPFVRAVRADKLTLTAAESVLINYIKGEYDKIPVINMLIQDKYIIKKRAEAIKNAVCKFSQDINAVVVETTSTIGGGAFPATEFVDFGVLVSVKGISPQRLHFLLRTSTYVPVVAVLEEDGVLLHARTIFDWQIEDLVQTFKLIFEKHLFKNGD